MASNESSKSEKPISTLWGCELNEKNKTGTFRTDDTEHQHQLSLRTMCLGADAKSDEFNVVELVTEQGQDEIKAFPMATLRAPGLPTVNLCGIELHPPITFRLKNGSGPVYICGEHVALEDYSDEELEEAGEEMSEEEEEEEIEESPPKPAKKPATKREVPGKRKKPEEAGDGEGSDDENNPPKKGKGRGRKQEARKV
ncbi:nucleoplasmin-2b [Brienomyrus brachyistius]|uniref:nucleoplasmin-2b n=1 Tax=Brienomyrus brachyistius TaxID=42636 RepID=UPI0020B33FE0|nr:nucleoplasmin-2b [Brienomyrus brachyistius]